MGLTFISILDTITPMKESIPVLAEGVGVLASQFRENAASKGQSCVLIEDGEHTQFYYREYPGNPRVTLLVSEDAHFDDTSSFTALKLRVNVSLPETITAKIPGYDSHLKQLQKDNPGSPIEHLTGSLELVRMNLILCLGDLINSSLNRGLNTDAYPNHYFIARYGRIRQRATWSLSETKKFPLQGHYDYGWLSWVDIKNMGLPFEDIVDLPKTLLMYLKDTSQLSTEQIIHQPLVS